MIRNPFENFFRRGHSAERSGRTAETETAVLEARRAGIDLDFSFTPQEEMENMIQELNALGMEIARYGPPFISEKDLSDVQKQERDRLIAQRNSKLPEVRERLATYVEPYMKAADAWLRNAQTQVVPPKFIDEALITWKSRYGDEHIRRFNMAKALLVSRIKERGGGRD